MKRIAFVTLLLVGTSGVAGCSDEPTCDDVDELTAQLAETDPDDSEYNDLVNQLNQAAADCNS